MALSTLNGDAQGIIFNHLCNVLDPGAAVAFSSASSELRKLTQAERQLKADHEAAAALCLKLGHQSCKELREAKKVATFAKVFCWKKGLTAADLELLGKLSSVLPALERLINEKKRWRRCGKVGGERGAAGWARWGFGRGGAGGELSLATVRPRNRKNAVVRLGYKAGTWFEIDGGEEAPTTRRSGNSRCGIRAFETTSSTGAPTLGAYCTK